MKPRNIKDGLSQCPLKGGESFEELARGDGPFKIERIVSHGAASPENFWYDQPQDEFVMVVSGCAVIKFEDDFAEMKEGDWIIIKKRVRHRVEKTSVNPPCVWLTAFGNFS